MSNDDTSRPSSSLNQSFFRRFGVLRLIAEHSIKGPSSIVLKVDFEVRTIRLEPIIRLTSTLLAPRNVTSQSLFAVPNCIEHAPGEVIVLRTCTWEGDADMQVCRIGNCSNPSLCISHSMIDDADVLDRCLLELDRRLSCFPFDHEGLDLEGSSGITAVPEDADVRSTSMRFGIYRRTRYQTTDLNWVQGKVEAVSLETAWIKLWQFLSRAEKTGTNNFEVIEQFDIDPESYAELLWAKFKSSS